MITVGLIKELLFISEALKTPVDVTLQTQIAEPIYIKIYNKVLEVYYGNDGVRIWRETIDGDASMFGVESCDTLARIIHCWQKGDKESAKKMLFIEP